MHKALTRRDLLLAGGSAAMACSYAERTHASDKQQPSTNRPNVVFIMADDMGYADASCYGRRDYKTPHIDSLARDGVKYMQGYANSAVCSATRTALMTGRYQYRLPVGLEEPLYGRDLGLPPDHPTIPSILRDAGYQTALVGKWHLGALPNYGPLKSGYDHFWGFRGGGIDYLSHESPSGPDLWDNEIQISETGYLTELLGQRAATMIDAFAGSARPFFLSLHFSAPHWPWIGPEDHAESARIAENGSLGLVHLDGGNLKTYATIMRNLDDQVGKVIQALERNGIAENTIVIFTSDNGGERFSDTWPFNGRKTELLEGGLRIPCIVRWPGKIPAGSTTSDISITMDWAPTLLAACGVADQEIYGFDGVDLFAKLNKGADEERTLFWRYKYMDQEACRRGPWKYLKVSGNTFLFNVEEDPMERANLKERERPIYESLVDAFEKWSATMLPIDPKSLTGGFTGADIADRFGVSGGGRYSDPAE